MSIFKENENQERQFQSNISIKSHQYHQSCAKSERKSQIDNLRNIMVSQTLDWRVNFEQFQFSVESCHNYYTILKTAFDISEDPQWRNKVQHLSMLIQKLHNDCSENGGAYLSQLTHIENYQQKLQNMLYLSDFRIQQHLKLLINIFLAYNRKFWILNEPELSLHLLRAAKGLNNASKLSQYLWVIAQIQTNQACVCKMLSILMGFQGNTSQLDQKILLAGLSILANYIYSQENNSVIDKIINFSQFQTLLMKALSSSNHYLNQAALLICNNILAKSRSLSILIMKCDKLMHAIQKIGGKQRDIFEQIAKIRLSEMSNNINED